MVRKALKSALWVAIGVTVGGCILPRLFFSNTYNETWPPLWKHAISYFVIGYAISFLMFLAVNWISSNIKK